MCQRLAEQNRLPGPPRAVARCPPSFGRFPAPPQRTPFTDNAPSKMKWRIAASNREFNSSYLFRKCIPGSMALVNLDERSKKAFRLSVGELPGILNLR
jgi:hypothetical protein